MERFKSQNRDLTLMKIWKYLKQTRADKWIIFFMLVYIVLIIKLVTFKEIENSVFFGVYSILVAFYILSRFSISYFYDPDTKGWENYTPSVTIVTPSKNEGDNIAKTLRCMLNSDYPKEKIEIIAINDGSTDNTLDEMLKVQKEARKKGISMKVIHWAKNKGKRHGMAEGIRKGKGEMILFVDSDSFLEKSTIKELMKYFRDPKIAAVAGHADVHNHDANFLTKMQTVRYYVAFKAYKSAEAIFGSVVCCSGCCSAYRKSYVTPILDEWLNQKFLGVECTYGDDRALTNFLIKDYKAVYAPEARVTTIVPESYKVFFKQQLRWKKSWTRESLRASKFMWRKNPLMSISFFLGVILPLLAPVVVFRALFWLPFSNSVMPFFYIGGLVLMSGVYGAYYNIFRKDKLWIYGVFFAWFYSLIMIWQLPYAILTLRNSSWGTR